MTQPILIPLRAIVKIEEVLAVAGTQRILVADCYIEACETWTPVPWGWETRIGHRTIVNVDRHVSAGNLAMEYLAQHRPDPNTVVVINHTDCDSVISSALLCGLLDPKPGYAEAVIAADHTGVPNAIADLLQALDASRDYEGSLHNLRLLENNQSLEPETEARLDERQRERALATQLVNEGAFHRIAKIAVATLPIEQRVSGEFLPPLLEDAWAIVSGTPMPNNRELWETKIRLGLAAPQGLSLFKLGVLEAEPAFGGRWNAGSTKRAGGSAVAPRDVALRLAYLMQNRSY